MLRATLAFVLLPGIVAYLVPNVLARQLGDRQAGHWFGALAIAAGTAALVECARAFLVAGKGTLAPWAPPRRLVTGGLYRYSRNPMYLAVLAVLVGWSIWYGSLGLMVYALVMAVAFHLRVVVYEEPRLRATFGRQWLEYADLVRRWI